MFSLIVLAFCLLVPVACAWIAGLDVGYAAGLYAGSQTISASIGVASDQIERLGLSAAEAKAQADAIPIGYAVTYIFGTIGSAVLLAQLGPKLIGVDLPAACAEYEKQHGWCRGPRARRPVGVPSHRGACLLDRVRRPPSPAGRYASCSPNRASSSSACAAATG